MDWKLAFAVLFVVFGQICEACFIQEESSDGRYPLSFRGDDFDDRNCKVYKEIPEDEYNRDPKSAGDLSKRPLGFLSTTIPFANINANAKNPCFKISLANSTRQTVQVLAKSVVGNSKICLRNQPPYSEATCQSGIKTCQDSPIGYSNIKYVFYCDGCETDIPIWFRLTISPSFTDGLDFEDWCGRNAFYPESLITFTGREVENTTPRSKSSYASLANSLLFFISLAFLFTHTL